MSRTNRIGNWDTQENNQMFDGRGRCFGSAEFLSQSAKDDFVGLRVVDLLSSSLNVFSEGSNLGS